MRSQVLESYLLDSYCFNCVQLYHFTHTDCELLQEILRLLRKLLLGMLQVL